jgi:hypothetical protein
MPTISASSASLTSSQAASIRCLREHRSVWKANPVAASAKIQRPAYATRWLGGFPVRMRVGMARGQRLGLLPTATPLRPRSPPDPPNGDTSTPPSPGGTRRPLAQERTEPDGDEDLAAGTISPEAVRVQSSRFWEECGLVAFEYLCTSASFSSQLRYLSRLALA